MEKEIRRTIIPFLERPRLEGEEVEKELYDEIKNIADKYNKPTKDFSAKFELIPDPDPNVDGHFLISEVTYEEGKLNQ